jgi:NAD(P)-dependent dehydrogenase (short-subunit alcohol dehydrogenase family)
MEQPAAFCVLDRTMAGRLSGKVAVVTGAAGGIGRASCERFAAEGGRVVAVDLDTEALRAVEAWAALAVTCDVRRSEQVEALFAQVRREFGRLDVLFNVAGGSGRRRGDAPVEACTEEAWDYVLDLNLRSVFLCCKHALPLMRLSGGGSIVNVGSVLGLVGHELFDTHAYAASKGAVLALSRAMAVRYAPEKIRVNVLCPGLIRTPMSERAQADQAIRAALPALQPLTGDFGEPQDVAEAALYLASDESRFVTGIALPVDGGWTAR